MKDPFLLDVDEVVQVGDLWLNPHMEWVPVNRAVGTCVGFEERGRFRRPALSVLNTPHFKAVELPRTHGLVEAYEPAWAHLSTFEAVERLIARTKRLDEALLTAEIEVTWRGSKIARLTKLLERAQRQTVSGTYLEAQYPGET